MDKTGKEEPRMILALDLETTDEALGFLRRWGKRIKYVKIGPGLFAQGGTDFITRLQEDGRKTFLDLKLHDIPNTVAEAVKFLSSKGVWAITLHTSGGRSMMESAVKVRKDKSTLLFGVTVLTSLDSTSWDEVHPGCSINDALAKRAEIAVESGMDGIVCSPRELGMFNSDPYDGLLKIVPGIRPADYGMFDDQRRTATPSFAAEGGADFVVVGRPVTRAADPGRMIDTILRDLKR